MDRCGGSATPTQGQDLVGQLIRLQGSQLPHPVVHLGAAETLGGCAQVGAGGARGVAANKCVVCGGQDESGGTADRNAHDVWRRGVATNWEKASNCCLPVQKVGQWRFGPYHCWPIPGEGGGEGGGGSLYTFKKKTSQSRAMVFKNYAPTSCPPPPQSLWPLHHKRPKIKKKSPTRLEPKKKPSQSPPAGASFLGI